MFQVKRCFILLSVCFLSACNGNGNTSATVTTSNVIDESTLTPKQVVGKKLFFDANLSEPAGQSCASCHDPAFGFADPDQNMPTSQGIHRDRFGDRNTPTAAYAAFSPDFHYNEIEGLFVGGQFVDGRAATLKDQAKGPFLNILEMANPDKATVVSKVANSSYATLFQQVYGFDAFFNIETAYDNIADAIADFEKTSFFSPFSSKYDTYLAGKATFNDLELLGLKVFEDEKKGNCAACHPSQPSNGIPPLFTDFTYDNLGVPRNENNPFLHLPSHFNKNGRNHKDLGLGGATHVNNSAQYGKFKVPTLRNIALTAPYMHNGVFKTLEEVVEFYNTRDIDPKWSAPEVADNVNREELGNLKLTQEEINALVIFMTTLTDGYQP